MAHFFIANQDKPSEVLEISGSPHGGKLVLNEAKETDNDNQLWFLNQEGQLVSKISKVAASVSVTDETEGEEELALSQRWIFEDEKIMSSLNNLYMEADGNGDIKMKSSSDSKRQLWTPVPVDMLDHYKLMKEYASPLLEASFYKEMYTNYFAIVSGFNSIQEFKEGAKRSLSKMRQHADQLDKVNQDTATAEAVAGGANTAGGIMGILGLVLAIPTAGTSLVLTYGGVALGVAGTVTSVTASTINDGWEKSERDAFRSEMKKILRLQGFINTFLEKMNSAAEFLKTDKGKEAILDHLKLSTAWDDKLKVAVNVGEGVWDLYKIQGSAVKTYKDAKTYMTAMKMFKDFGLGDWYAVNGVKQGIAAFASAPEIALPGFLGGKVLVSAASASAKAISGGRYDFLMDCFTIVFYVMMPTLRRFCTGWCNHGNLGNGEQHQQDQQWERDGR